MASESTRLVGIQLADAPATPISNRAARWIPLIGCLELVIWAVLAFAISIECALESNSTLTRQAQLMLWSAGHIVIGAAALSLCACPECLVTGFFLCAGALLSIIDLSELVVRLADLVDVFPNNNVFSFVYAAFNAILLLLAAWLTAVSWRAGTRYFGFGLATTWRSYRPSSAPLYDNTTVLADSLSAPKKTK